MMKARMQNLWASVVGSHAWGMQRPDSDLDIVVIGSSPTRDVFTGKRPASKFEEKLSPDSFASRVMNFPVLGVDPAEVDLTTWEIGNLVEQLRKGNINAMWAVLSPKQHAMSPIGSMILQSITRVVKSSPVPRLTWKSVRGMVHNTERLCKNRPEMLGKKVGMMHRTLVQFERFLQSAESTGMVELDFSPVAGTWTIEDVEDTRERLDGLVERSAIPDNLDRLVNELDWALYTARKELFMIELSEGIA